MTIGTVVETEAQRAIRRLIAAAPRVTDQQFADLRELIRSHAPDGFAPTATGPVRERPGPRRVCAT